MLDDADEESVEDGIKLRIRPKSEQDDGVGAERTAHAVDNAGRRAARGGADPRYREARQRGGLPREQLHLTRGSSGLAPGAPRLPVCCLCADVCIILGTV